MYLFVADASSHCQPQTTTNLFYVSVDCFFCRFYINGIVQFVAFCVWLLLLSMIFFEISSTLYHVSVVHSSLFLINTVLYGNSHFCLSIHQSIGIWVFSGFWLFLVAAINIHVQVFASFVAFISQGIDTQLWRVLIH